MLNKVISVFGHKNPDSDSVLAAIILSEFFKIRGENAIPYTQGKINGESAFALNRYGVPVPKVFNSIDEIADTQIAIVDTANINQLPENINRLPIRMVVDHHNLGGLVTPNAPEYWGRPVGSTCTILFELFKYYKIKMTPVLSALTLCGILSDTLCFAAATTTETDKKIARKLARECDEDIKMLWEELLTAKSDISNLTDNELITDDAKEFVFNGKSFLIGNLEINDSASVLPRLSTIREEMQRIKNEKNYFGVLFCVIDISKEKTLFICFTDDNNKIEHLFNIKLSNNEVFIHKLISRKKDIVPILQSGF
jgi:manganese-dependent inorganic pyrophosphatase